MFHRSERLFLRPIWPEDWQGVLGGIRDESVVRNLATVPWPYDENHAREFAGRAFDPFHPTFLATRASDAAVVGCIGLGAVEGREAVELGYWIARPFWGQGFATEAGRAVVGIARVLGHRELESSHFLDNPASGRVLRKLGFEPTGRIVQRHSCARGQEVEAAEYRLRLVASEGERQRAA
ncbi:GNAT family N-acetyltransferase [Erythrobacter sp. HL-111]|uniref:GNAT family N-acetyltransferase n=1 Tax=Erythrobacter sp. HL-111 TaxID=1798193 RepID=UPI000879D5C4|nr:GNAT family N-acetyltransferase [Erythrobacter sp. HL-111]SDR72036.1 Protein N-acetyltransferase, RimJ/RimL family [Erythrobacter sp. HL-111]